MTWRYSSLPILPKTSSALCRLDRDRTAQRSPISAHHTHTCPWYADRPCLLCLESKTGQTICDHLMGGPVINNSTGKKNNSIRVRFILAVGGSSGTSKENLQARTRRKTRHYHSYRMHWAPYHLGSLQQSAGAVAAFVPDDRVLCSRTWCS